jgi:hypothetical protein
LFRFLQTALLVGTIASVAAVVPAHADTLTFDFNSLSPGSAATASQRTNSANAIATYMSGVIGCSNCVTVTGAVADTTYNAEGYVTGPGNGSTSLTLGTSDGATQSNSTSTLNTKSGRTSYDTFIANTDNNSNQSASQITIKITGGHSLSGVLSFDYEIFPDGTGQIPDFIFDAYSGSTLLTSWTKDGIVPGSGGDGNSTKSPNSSSEAHKQYISTWSSVTALNNVTELDFIDWPATIGVDNLVVTSSVPEPGAVVLLGTLMAAFLWKFARKRQAA